MKKLLFFFLAAVFALSASIVDPRWGVVAYVEPGGVLNITLDSPIQITSVALAAPGIDKPYQLKFKAEGNVISAVVPVDIPQGLYDIVINDGQLYEPKAVWVAKITGPLRIVQITDSHMGVELDMASFYRLIHHVFYANAGPFDLVVFTGDQADVGGQQWHYELFVKATSFLTKPVLTIPGNHDHAGDDALVNYRRYVGPPVWYRVVGPYLIIGLDSGIDGYLRDDTVKFYEDVLKKYPDKVKIVLIHHPPFYLADSYVEEIYRGPQDIDRLNRDPTGRRSYYLIYTSHLQNRPAFEKFLELTIRYRVALVMAGHVHSGNSTIVINGTYFVTTRTAGGSIDTTHGVRTYTVYPDGRVEVGREVATYKYFAAVTWGNKAAQIYVDTPLVTSFTIDLPGEYQGLKALAGQGELVKIERHPLGKYVRYTVRLSSTPAWIALGDYAPNPRIEVLRILPRTPTKGDIVTVSLKAEDPATGVLFLTVNGTKVLGSYLDSPQPVYQYRFKYDRPTALEITAPGAQPYRLQIGQPAATTTPSPTTTSPTTTPTPQQTTPITTSQTPTATTPATTATPTPTAQQTPATTTTPAVTAAPQPSAFPVEALALIAIAAAGGIALMLAARRK